MYIFDFSSYTFFRVEASASIRDSVRAPYNSTSGRDDVESLRL